VLFSCCCCCYCCLLFVDDDIVVVFRMLSDLLILDTETNEWLGFLFSQAYKPPQSRWAHAAAAWDGTLLVYGGANTTQTYSDLYLLAIDLVIAKLFAGEKELFSCLLFVVACLFVVCLFVVCLLFVCCLFVVCLLFVCCLFVVCLLFVCCLFVVCLLFVCCRESHPWAAIPTPLCVGGISKR